MSLRGIIKNLAQSTPVTRAMLQRRYEGIVIKACKDHCGADVTFQPDAVSIRKGNQVIRINPKISIYTESLASQFDVFFTAVRSTEINGLQIVDYTTPKLHTLQDGLQFEFSYFPEEADSVTDYFRWYKPNPGDTIFDLGANCGLSVYYFSKAVDSTGRVICFEPDPANSEILARNIARHNLTNVTVVKSAIGGADGSIDFSAEGTPGSQILKYLGRNSVGKVITVPLVALSTAFDQYGAPDLCKIDIEGAEIEALESISHRLPTLGASFVVGTNHMVAGEWSKRRVEEIFQRAGYETVTTQEPFLTTYARRPPSPADESQG
jgi:FkbM family methyltransferase